MDHAMTDDPPPSWRKPAGALAILLLIVAWCVLVVSLSATVNAWAWPLQLVFYLVTGIVWIMPLKPLLLWMEKGRWRL
jgi:predicted membrane channel-forming protein YqfA (hemolysin III family)